MLAGGALLTGALAWFASGELAWPARLLAALLLGPAPVLFMLQASAATNYPRPLPRVQVYAGSIIALWLLALVSFGAAIASGFRLPQMGFTPLRPVAFTLWSAVAVLASGGVVILFRMLRTTESDIMREITPVTGREKSVFVLLSVSAGICEELTFRGVLLPALATATGTMIGGVVLSSMAFGVLHAHQNIAGTVRAAVLGAVLAVPVLATGSIYPSMTAHALIDVIGGLWLARWLFK